MQKQSIFFVPPPSFPTLEESIETEILVIGGGIAGILTAYYLTQEGKKVVVVDKNTIASGMTLRSTSTITLFNDLSYANLLSSLGHEKTKTYVRGLREALKEYQFLASTYAFSYETCSCFQYATTKKEFEKEKAALSTLKIPFRVHEKLPLPFEIQGALEISQQAQMNAVQLIYALAKTLTIYEHTFITELTPMQATCANRKIIRFQQAVVATHYPFINRRGNYFLKLYQQRSFVVALKNSSIDHAIFASISGNGYYLRTYKDLLLVGGNDARTGKTKDALSSLITTIQADYPSASIEAYWGNQDCISLDGLPYVGTYSHHWPSIYVISGLSMSGMTHAMMGAHLLKDRILGIENPLAAIFNPHRRIKLNAFLKHAGHSTIALLTPTKHRCTHLGCALKWNQEEQSFDCPCHGSRFLPDGQIVANPAQKKKKE